MKLLIDLDNTIAQTNKAFIELYKLETGDMSATEDKIQSWWYDEACPQWNQLAQAKAFMNPKLFELLKPFSDAVETLFKLQSEGHEIIICTMHDPKGIPYKSEWIKYFFSFIKNVIYIDIDSTLHKSLIKGNILLDDNIDNLLTSPCDYKICYGNSLWNSDWRGLRVNNFKEFYDMIHTLEDTDKALKLLQKEKNREDD